LQFGLQDDEIVFQVVLKTGRRRFASLASARFAMGQQQV